MVDFCGSGLLAKRRGKIPWLGTTVPLLFMRDTYSMILGNLIFFFLVIDYLIFWRVGIGGSARITSLSFGMQFIPFCCAFGEK
jgi:hypothetical protein